MNSSIRARLTPMPLVAATFLVAIQAVSQQPALLTTAATTTRNQAGQDMAWLAWEANTPGLLNGRFYALYAKAGAPSAPAPFERRAILPVLPTATLLAPLLTQAASLGLEVEGLGESLTAMGAPPGVSIAEQLASL